MSHINHPLFSDELYGGSDMKAGLNLPKFKQFVHNCFQEMPRQALHARVLGFIHPTSGEKMRFEQELPEDFRTVIDKVRSYTSQL